MISSTGNQGVKNRASLCKGLNNIEPFYYYKMKTESVNKYKENERKWNLKKDISIQLYLM